MNHKNKVKMARKMLTREERKTKPVRTPLFLSRAWESRAKTIMESIKNRLAGYQIKKSVSNKRVVLPWQDYAATVCKDFNITGNYKKMVFMYSKKNLEYVKGKVENTKEKFGEANLGDKGNYLIALFRKEKPWDVKK